MLVVQGCIKRSIPATLTAHPHLQPPTVKGAARAALGTLAALRATLDDELARQRQAFGSGVPGSAWEHVTAVDSEADGRMVLLRRDSEAGLAKILHGLSTAAAQGDRRTYGMFWVPPLLVRLSPAPLVRPRPPMPPDQPLPPPLPPDEPLPPPLPPEPPPRATCCASPGPRLARPLAMPMFPAFALMAAYRP